MISILIDGLQLPLGRPLIMKSGAVLAPVAGVVDRIADRIRYDHSGMIIISRGTRNFILFMQQRRAWSNLHWLALPVIPTVHASTVYLPLRSVVLGLGGQLNYDGRLHLISIHLPAESVPVAMTPIPAWSLHAPLKQVFTPVPSAMPHWSTPPGPRRTPLHVGPEYREF